MSEDKAWEEFISYEKPEYREDLTKARDLCRKYGIKCTGVQHQYPSKPEHWVDDHEDLAALLYKDDIYWTQRHWGAFMAAVWSKPDGKEYDYIHFYM